ncbi:MAG: hypothetical protein ACOCUV_01535 [bacterium]
MKFPSNKKLQVLFYMFFSLGILTFILAIGLTIIMIDVSDEDERAQNEYKKIEATYGYQGNKITLSRTIKAEDGNDDNEIKNIFKNNTEYIIKLDSKANSRINLTFKDPVYIKDLTIYERIPRKSGDKSRPKKILIRMNGISYEFFSDWIEYEVPGNKMVHKISFREKPGFYSIFVIKYLSINIEPEKNNNSEPSQFVINRIKINYSKKPYLEPTMSVDEIKKRYVRGRKKWNISSAVRFHTIRQLDIEDLLIYEALLNLSYYSINGDKEAEELLLNYSPTGAIHGEYVSAIQEWYEKTKIYNSKENIN